jgi:pimeloyl-ACP methyl ester carboxylesterase
MSTTVSPKPITEHELEQVKRANATTATPVVFVHGLWLLPSSWEPWAALFEEAGYVALTPAWPDDPETVEKARANPDVLAKKTLKQVAVHTTEIINALDKKPAVIGHSTGGLLAQMLAGRGLSAATVAIDPGVFRGVLPLPASVLRGVGPFLVNPLTRGRAITLTFDQFKYGWANALDEKEAKQLYDTFHVAGSGISRADGQREPQPVDRGEGEHEEPRTRSPADHRGREGPHGAVGDRERRLQAAEAQPRRNGDREDPESRPRPHDRPRLARGRPDGARLRQEVHLAGARSYLDRDGLRGQYLSGVQDPSRIDPDNWVIDEALIDRPGADEIMLADWPSRPAAAFTAATPRAPPTVA